MPYPQHYLLSWGGDFVSDPTEVWNNNLRFAPDDNLDGNQFVSYDDGVVTAALADFTTRITAFHQTLDCGYSSNTRLKFVKLNEIGPDGRYVSSSQSNTQYLTPPGQLGSGNGLGPLTTALAVTFLTSAERGPGSRGRVFVPHPAITVSNTTYRVASTKTTAIATAWRTFLDSLEFGQPLGQMVPSVVSNRGTSGVARTINRVQVGDFPDYMSTRRNRLTENRVTSATFN